VKIVNNKRVRTDPNTIISESLTICSN